jgi:uncharacterized protein with HEPN domain
MLTTAPFLTLIENAGQGVLVLIDGLDEADFARSRLTRAEVGRLVRLIGGTLAGLPDMLRDGMPEIDWAGWHTTLCQLDDADPSARTDAAWFAARALVPATLSWLRIHRQSRPDWFRFSPD